MPRLLLWFFFLAVALCPAVAQGKTIDLAAIILKTKSQVEKVLGAPDECSKRQHQERCYFEGRKKRITFINGQADWIELLETDLPFSPNALPQLGFARSRPNYSNELIMTWTRMRHQRLEPNSKGKFDRVYLRDLHLHPSGRDNKAGAVTVIARTRMDDGE